MKFRSTKLPLFVTLALGTLFLANTMFAQTAAAGKHPAYLHALSDLRAARGYLSEMSANYKMDDAASKAIEDIDLAIGELKKASIDDGKNLKDHPPIDATLAKTGRYHRSLELLDSALADVKKEEDDAATKGLQTRIIDHIAAAHHEVKDAIAAAK